MGNQSSVDKEVALRQLELELEMKKLEFKKFEIEAKLEEKKLECNVALKRIDAEMAAPLNNGFSAIRYVTRISDLTGQLLLISSLVPPLFVTMKTLGQMKAISLYEDALKVENNQARIADTLNRIKAMGFSDITSETMAMAKKDALKRRLAMVLCGYPAALFVFYAS
jgi:hypothetical protein